MKYLIAFIICIVCYFSINTANELTNYYSSQHIEEKLDSLHGVASNTSVILFFFILTYMLTIYKYEVDKSDYITNKSKEIIKNENDIRFILIENLNHEISTPLAVLNNKIEKYSKFYSAVDKNLIDSSFNHIYNIINKIHQYKIIKQIDQTIYDIMLFAFESVSIGYSYIDYNIDPELKNFKTSINNLDLAGIIINFIKNSIEANATNINIILQNNQIIVRDNGNSIEPTMIKEICPANTSKNNKLKGSGIFISKMILKENKGHMNIVPNEHGTDVILTIPIIKINNENI